MSTLEVSNLNDGTTTLATTFINDGSAKMHVRHTSAAVVKDTSLNVSSVTDNGTGDYTVNFISSFSGRNYTAAVHSDSGSSTTVRWAIFRNDQTNLMGTKTYSSSSQADNDNQMYQVWGDLA